MATASSEGPVSTGVGIATCLVALALAGCTGSDRLTEPLVSAGGAYFAALGDAGVVSSGGGNGNPASLVGGSPSTNGTRLDGGEADAGFDWGPVKFDRNGGSTVTYQDHYDGEPCFASCHEHSMTIGGTVYQTNGTDPAPNVEIGIWLGGTLFTSYSGTSGNFFANFLSVVDWSRAEIAIRTAGGEKRMQANPKASGDCNLCHGSGQRLVAP